jgi:hypothetical protein
MPQCGRRAAARRDDVEVRRQHRRGCFSRTGDPMIGEFNDARLLQKFGNVPEDLSGA